MLPTAVPRPHIIAVSDEGPPDVDIETPSPYEQKPSSQTPLRVLKGHTRSVVGLAFFPCRLACGSWAPGEAEKACTGHIEWVRSVAMAPDGDVFASGPDDNTLKVTGNQVGGPIATHPQRGGVWGLSFSPDGQHVAATGSSGNGAVQIRNALTRALVTETIHIPHGWDCTVVFSLDGSRIVAAEGGSVGIWEKEHTDYVRCTAAASYDKTICRWDMKSGAQIGKPLTGHSNHDEKTLATPSSDQTVRFWDLETGNQNLGRMALSRNGTSLLASKCLYLGHESYRR
ncbi:WD40 repeat-like protein [Paxillus ammoniavirescens]|nr:WD40 repeat-like protein [Paxillus ammoniavirescens]